MIALMQMRQEQEGSAMNLPVMSFDEAEFLAKASGLPLVAPDPASFFLAGYEHARALIDRRRAEIDKVQQFLDNHCAPPAEAHAELIY